MRENKDNNNLKTEEQKRRTKITIISSILCFVLVATIIVSLVILVSNKRKLDKIQEFKNKYVFITTYDSFDKNKKELKTYFLSKNDDAILKIEEPKKDGYIFIKWKYFENNLLLDFNKDEFLKNKRDIKLYPEFKKIK